MTAFSIGVPFAVRGKEQADHALAMPEVHYRVPQVALATLLE